MNNFVILTTMMTVFVLQSVAASEMLPEPKEVVLEKGETIESKSQEILAARHYAAFWGTGDKSHIDEALDQNFVDRTLPDGRQQGLQGPLDASVVFRSAIPDLKVEIEKMIVATDHVVLHLNFEGHFTGTFKGIEGNGQKINFIATDIYKIKNGKITDNWHIEDNLTLFQQMGITD